VARPLWRGSLSFGLVNVPVQLVSSARDLDYHFRQLHEKDKVPIEQRRYRERLKRVIDDKRRERRSTLPGPRRSRTPSPT
jgi:non-homologous end joining protein Ku